MPYCQAQSQLQPSWTESALISLLDRPDPDRTGIVSRCSSRLAFATFKGTRGFLRSFFIKQAKQTYHTKPNQIYQTKPAKLNLPNQSHNIKPTKANLQYLQNQTYQTKHTIPNRPNQIKTWQAKACPELGTAQPQLVLLFG